MNLMIIVNRTIVQNQTSGSRPSSFITKQQFGRKSSRKKVLEKVLEKVLKKSSKIVKDLNS